MQKNSKRTSTKTFLLFKYIFIMCMCEHKCMLNLFQGNPLQQILIKAQTGLIGTFHCPGQLLVQPNLIGGLLKWYNSFIMHAKGQHG